MSMVGMARARPDQVRKVLDQVQQQGLSATYKKVMNKLDSYTPLGYSLSGVVTEVGRGAEEFEVGQLVACAGNEQALHAEYNWVPVNLCAAVPPGVLPEHAAFATVASIGRGGRLRGVPSDPLGDVEIEVLLAPDHPGEGLALNEAGIRVRNTPLQLRVKLVRFPYPSRERLIEMAERRAVQLP